MNTLLLLMVLTTQGPTPFWGFNAADADDAASIAALESVTRPLSLARLKQDNPAAVAKRAAALELVEARKLAKRLGLPDPAIAARRKAAIAARAATVQKRADDAAERIRARRSRPLPSP